MGGSEIFLAGRFSKDSYPAYRRMKYPYLCRYYALARTLAEGTYLQWESTLFSASKTPCLLVLLNIDRCVSQCRTYCTDIGSFPLANAPIATQQHRLVPASHRFTKLLAISYLYSFNQTRYGIRPGDEKSEVLIKREAHKRHGHISGILKTSHKYAVGTGSQIN